MHAESPFDALLAAVRRLDDVAFDSDEFGLREKSAIQKLLVSLTIDQQVTDRVRSRIEGLGGQSDSHGTGITRLLQMETPEGAALRGVYDAWNRLVKA